MQYKIKFKRMKLWKERYNKKKSSTYTKTEIFGSLNNQMRLHPTFRRKLKTPIIITEYKNIIIKQNFSYLLTLCRYI